MAEWTPSSLLSFETKLRNNDYCRLYIADDRLLVDTSCLLINLTLSRMRGRNITWTLVSISPFDISVRMRKSTGSSLQAYNGDRALYLGIRNDCLFCQRLFKWLLRTGKMDNIEKKEICELHGTRHDSCVCSPPYKLFAFRSAITDDDGRNCWIKGYV